MTPKMKIGIAAFSIIGVIIILLILGMSQTSTYYLTVDEYLIKQNSIGDKPVKVSGRLIGSTLDWKPEKLELRFSLRGENGEILPVLYKGVKPDSFYDDWQAIVQGTLDENGVFIADELLVKCPSKYEAEQQTTSNENM